MPLLLCAVLAHQPVEPPGKVELRLVFSSEKFDPTRPGKETVKGIVVNNSGKPVPVPAWYDGRYAQIKAGPREAVGSWELMLYGPMDEKMKWVEVRPGARKVLFELKLAEAMPLKREKGASLQWWWYAKFLTPPASPALNREGSVVAGKMALHLRLADEKGFKVESPKVEVEVVAGKK